MSFLVIYTLTVYFLWHVAARSDILARPRQWLIDGLPGWLTYPLSCPLCWCFWISVSLTAGDLLSTGTLTPNPVILCAAPVLCYLIGLVSSALHAYLGDDLTPRLPSEPPLLATHPTVDLSGGPTSGPVLSVATGAEDSIAYLKRTGLLEDRTVEDEPPSPA